MTKTTLASRDMVKRTCGSDERGTSNGNGSVFITRLLMMVGTMVWNTNSSVCVIKARET